LEDQAFPKRCGHLSGKTLVPVEEMAEKIAAAVRARRDKDFLIVARTDARAIEGVDSAVQRATSYLEAGADMIFPEAPQSAKEFRDFARRIRAPLMANMTEFGRSPLLTVDELADMGYRIVIFPQTAFRVSMHAAENCLGDLKRRGTQKGWIDHMQTREDLYELLRYKGDA
jgi:methylisocitrate lyase